MILQCLIISRLNILDSPPLCDYAGIKSECMTFLKKQQIQPKTRKRNKPQNKTALWIYYCDSVAQT